MSGGLGAPPLLGMPSFLLGLPSYLEVQVIQGSQVLLPFLHLPDHLWGPVVLKGLQMVPKLEGSFLEHDTCREKKNSLLKRGRVSIMLWEHTGLHLAQSCMCGGAIRESFLEEVISKVKS